MKTLYYIQIFALLVIWVMTPNPTDMNLHFIYFLNFLIPVSWLASIEFDKKRGKK